MMRMKQVDNQNLIEFKSRILLDKGSIGVVLATDKIKKVGNTQYPDWSEVKMFTEYNTIIERTLPYKGREVNFEDVAGFGKNELLEVLAGQEEKDGFLYFKPKSKKVQDFFALAYIEVEAQTGYKADRIFEVAEMLDAVVKSPETSENSLISRLSTSAKRAVEKAGLSEEQLRTMTEEELTSVSGIGPATVKSIVESR